jgi:hypothetical protein
MGCCNTKNLKDEVSKNENDFSCPSCGEQGSSVELITLQSLILDEVKERIHEDSNYKYCKNPKCQIAYFTASEEESFFVRELKEKATAKDNGMDVKVCYCFNHTRESILSELNSTGVSTVLADVKAKMKDPGCFCERSNPQGGCCLGNLTAWVKDAKALLSR